MIRLFVVTSKESGMPGFYTDAPDMEIVVIDTDYQSGEYADQIVNAEVGLKRIEPTEFIF